MTTAIAEIEPVASNTTALREIAAAQLRVIADETGMDLALLASEYAKVDLIERAMADVLNLIDWFPEHHFSKGLYAREQAIPAGFLITGVCHRTEHMSIISKGSMDVWTPFEGMKRVKAPYRFTAQPGTRRVAYIYEDLVWTCFHATEETDLEQLKMDLYFEYRNPLLTDKEVRLWLE